jgi:putative transposase
MVTSQTWERRSLFRNERWAALLIDTLYHYRGEAYLLHEFVVMPDHIHIILRPLTSLEKAVQFIKGGFSYRAKKELGSNMEVWQKGFSDHRIRDAGDYAQHVSYVRENPVRKHLCEKPELYPYSSANSNFQVDKAPQGLKPEGFVALDGAAKAAPLQNLTSGAVEAAPLQNLISGAPEGPPLQIRNNGADEASALRSKPAASDKISANQSKNKIA